MIKRRRFRRATLLAGTLPAATLVAGLGAAVAATAQPASPAVLTLSKHAIVYGGSLSGTFRVPASDGGNAVITYGRTRLVVPVAADHDAHFKILAGALPAGMDTVTARYTGTATVAPSHPVTSSVRVAKAASTVALAVAPPSIRRGREVRVHYAVHGRRYGAQPTGLITLTVSTHGLKRRIELTVPASGHGQTRLTMHHIGRTSVALRYGGDADYTAARSTTSRVRVHA